MKHRDAWRLSGRLILCLLILSQTVEATPLMNSGGTHPLTERGVDHAVYNTLLQRYVDRQGLVNYRAWKRADTRALDQYLAAMGRVDPATLHDRSEQLAFWINVYNAQTIRGILKFYPTRSIKDHAGLIGFNIWKNYTLPIHGRAYSLDDIEHRVLRKMDEPQIHFAIVCASIGCPRLLNEAYTGPRMEEQLAANTRVFFTNPGKFLIDRTRKIVYLSPILDWYGEDFGGTDRAKLDFIKRILSNPEDRALLDSDGVSVKYLDYDWSLNEQK